MRFSSICLITDNVLALTRFYEQLLQTTSEGSEIHMELKTEGAGLAIYSREAAKEDMTLYFEKGKTNFTMGFLVEDVDAEYERLENLGVDILNTPKTYPWGARSMQVRDLDGNVISLACRI